MTVTVHHGDSREVLKTIPDGSIDACVCDPPYALVSIGKRFGKDGAAPAKVGKTGAYARASAGFMGQKWDTGETAFATEFWSEVYRVLKPGAHVVAFGGTRSFHRLACAIEDAGFEIRDSLFYCYGSGFPKSHNIGKKLDAAHQRCTCDKDMRGLREYVVAPDALPSAAQSNVLSSVQARPDKPVEHGEAVTVQSESDDQLRRVRRSQDDAAGVAAKGGDPDVLSPVQRRSARSRVGATRAQGTEGADSRELCKGGDARGEKPGMEGRRDASSAARKLRERPLRAMPARSDLHGPEGRLCDGAPAGDGAVGRPPSDSRGNGASQGPQAAEQPALEPGAVAGQSEPQAGGAWPVCRGCGQPIVPDGLGTALKPALEPIVLARKPLVGTVAANVLAHGCGALNIEASRVDAPSTLRLKAAGPGQFPHEDDASTPREVVVGSDNGRWPANVIHDGSDEVIAAFPEAPGQQADISHSAPSPKTGGIYGKMSREGEASAARRYVDKGATDFAPLPGQRRGDSGSAARFFYTAKADAEDRLGSKHPTVKPVDLMAYLCRLVTPPGGVILDPFAGTGTTGLAAMREGFDCILIEREAEYVADIERRLAWARGEGKLTAQEASRAPQKTADDLPLFSGEAA